MRQHTKYGKILELLYGVFFQPRKAMRKIGYVKPVWPGLLLYFIVQLTTIMIGISDMQSAELTAKVSGLGFILTTMGVGFSLISLFVVTAITRFTAELLGGQGSGLQTLTVFAFASLPNLLLAPVAVLSSLLGFDLSIIASVAAGIWIFIIEVIGIKVVHRFSTGNAVLAILAPLLLIIAVIILIIIAVSTLGSQIFAMMQL